MLTREQVVDLYELGRICDAEAHAAQLRAGCELKLWQSGVSPAQIGAITGEPKHRIARRIAAAGKPHPNQLELVR